MCALINVRGGKSKDFTLEKLGILEASAKAPDTITSKSLEITVNLMKVFKSSDSKPRDLIKVTQSGLILLALHIKISQYMSRLLTYMYPVK